MEKGMKMFSLLLILLLAISAVGGVAQEVAPEGVIKEIVIFGNERVEEAVIRKEIKSTVGEPFSNEMVREDVKSVYGLGYFRDVQVDVTETRGGVVVTFVVIEKPFVSDIVISGNVELSREDIEGVIEVKPDTVLEMDKVTSSVEEIKKLYTSKRYFGSEVGYEVALQEGNRAVVYFDIVEGVKGYLTKISFKGNTVFGARKLRSIMQTKEKGWWWWLTKSGRLERDVLEVDLSRIRSLYHDHGYVTVQVGEPEITLSDNRKSLQITISIEEGDQYRLGSLDITGDILTTKEELLKGLKSKVGKVYRSSEVQQDLLWLTDQYADEGYAYVDVSPLTRIDPEQKLVNLTYKIEKGDIVHIGRIEIEGNTKTRDKVIRRDLKIAEGDLYNSTRLRKSRERVMRSGYFKEVDFAPAPSEKKDLLDVDIRVDEAEMGRLELGAGYGNVTGVVGSLGISHGNLFGLGYKVNARAEVGEDVMNFRAGFNDPRVLDTLFSVGFEGYKETWDYTTYDVDVAGGSINIGREITDTIRADFSYLFEQVRIYDIDLDDLSTPEIEGYQPGDYIYTMWQRGANTTGKASLTITRNTINDPYNPTKGSNIWIKGSIAGLGGDNFFYSAEGGISWFHPIIGDLVVNLRGRAGFIRAYNNNNNEWGVPLNERFYVGGLNSMRGFEYGMVGPVDSKKEPIGALNMVSLQAELLYPLSKAIGLRGAAFYDVGKGWGHDSSVKWGAIDDPSTKNITPLRHAVGVGIRWYSPFGPIRIDWGYNLFPISGRGEKWSAWDFSMGAMF
jgi:outer membrane protein insertion porin family